MPRLGLGLGLNVGSSSYSSGAGSLMQWTGMGQGMYSTITGKNGGANISTSTRLRHYSPYAFRRFRIVVPVFETIGTPLLDTLLAGGQTVLYFQFGFEYPFVNAASGLAARIPVTFSGANYVRYDSSTHDTAIGYLISDIVDAGQWVPAFAFFGLHSTVEVPSGVVNNVLPYMLNATNFNERWACQSFSATSRLVGNGGATDFALASATVTKLGTTQTGVTGVFTPAMMLIETPLGSKCVVGIGDSLCQGNNEGQAGSSTFGDSMGSALGNAGWCSRGVFEKALLSFVNLGRGSDGTKFLSTANNWRFRKQLMVLANPTHILHENGVNDVSATISISGWAATTAYGKYEVRSANSNFYMCEVAGTSAGAGGPSGTGSAIVDGTVTWSYIGSFPASANPRGWGQIYAWDVNTHDQIKAALPSVKIVQSTTVPGSTSTDSWATEVNQTVRTGWGDGTTRFGLLNIARRAMLTRLSLSGVVDLSPALEISGTGKFVVNGVANYATQDGTHHNSKGADLASERVVVNQTFV
jgi:hypothetical protein